LVARTSAPGTEILCAAVCRIESLKMWETKKLGERKLAWPEIQN
jgi:hypothetical protein